MNEPFTIKMTAYRAKTAMANSLRENMSHPDEVRALPRALYKTEADLLPDPQPIVISGIAFNEAAERIAKLGRGDPVSVIGSLKPSDSIDKATGKTKHGLNVTLNNALSPYDIKKRRPQVAGD